MRATLPFPNEAERVAADDRAVAVLVHGTYADSPDSEGSKWWQAGSEFAERLRDRLPPGVRPARADEVFHWSGENSDRARNKAAGELLTHLRGFERDGRSYHLVGHSHGGSVIWHALKLATLSGKPLRGLRSWTTVGTPFLQHRSRAAFSAGNILAVLMTVALLKPFAYYSWAAYATVRAALAGKTPELLAPLDSEIGYMALLRAPILAALRLLGMPIERRADGILVGSYDPAGPGSFASYLFGTYEGWLLLAAMAVSAYLFLNLALLCFVPALESHRIRSELSLERKAYADYGAAWLGVWSRDDEAINGLRATLDLSVSFVGTMAPRERVFVSDTPSLLYRPIYWIVAPVFNHLARPIIDACVRGIVVRSAQGNDRPTAMLVDVTPTPVACVEADFRPLPSQYNDRLLAYSDHHAGDLAPKLRRLLGERSFAVGLEAFGAEISGRELIHTAYFDHDGVAAVIARNMEFGETGGDQGVGARLPLTLLTWFAHNKQEALRHSGALTALPSPRLRRRAA